jgi:hypothetical protein
LRQVCSRKPASGLFRRRRPLRINCRNYNMAAKD